MQRSFLASSWFFSQISGMAAIGKLRLLVTLDPEDMQQGNHTFSLVKAITKSYLKDFASHVKHLVTLNLESIQQG